MILGPLKEKFIYTYQNKSFTSQNGSMTSITELSDFKVVANITWPA